MQFYLLSCFAVTLKEDSAIFFPLQLAQKQPVLRRVHKYNCMELKVTSECSYLEIQERDYFTEELIFQLTA